MHRRNFILTTSASILAAGAGVLVPVRLRAAEGGMQVTAAQKFQVGDMTVTAISDGFIPLDVQLLQGIEPKSVEQMAEEAHMDPANIRAASNAYLVETGEDTWLIDSGAGVVFGPTMGGLGGVLEALGKDPAAITKLLITHLHGDHIGGSIAEGVALYPNAELVVTEADVNFWTSDEIQAQAPEMFRGAFDLAKAVVATYGDRVRTISGEAEAAPGITAHPLIGHTAGHTGYVLESGGDSLLIWGDAVVVSAVQFARPDVTTIFDSDPAQSVATRKDMLASVAGTDRMVAGMHLPFPGVGYVETAGEGYAFTPAPWQYF